MRVNFRDVFVCSFMGYYLAVLSVSSVYNNVFWLSCPFARRTFHWVVSLALGICDRSSHVQMPRAFSFFVFKRIKSIHLLLVSKLCCDEMILMTKSVLEIIKIGYLFQKFHVILRDLWKNLLANSDVWKVTLILDPTKYSWIPLLVDFCHCQHIK